MCCNSLPQRFEQVYAYAIPIHIQTQKAAPSMFFHHNSAAHIQTRHAFVALFTYFASPSHHCFYHRCSVQLFFFWRNKSIVKMVLCAFAQCPAELSAWWLGLAPATLEFWVRFPNERNQGKQTHPVLKYRVPHGSHPPPREQLCNKSCSNKTHTRCTFLFGSSRESALMIVY